MTNKVTEAAVRAAHAAQQEADLAAELAQKSKTQGWYSLLCVARVKRKELWDLQQKCRRELAAARRWSLAKNSLTLAQLTAGKMLRASVERDSCYPAIDHRECFLSNRRPIAILSHTYGTWEQCSEFALPRELMIERLPFSWYSPDHTMAVLFTRSNSF